MKKLDFVKTTAVASIFAATIAASPAFANTTATFTVSDDAVKEIATIQRSMMEDADESESTSYEAGDEMAEGYLDPLDIQNDMPDAVSDEDLIEGEDTAVEVEVNSDTVILPTPEREGYVFIEWNSESDGSGESFQAGDTFVITSEVELFAIWEEKERSSLTLNFNEDSFVKENFFEEEEGAKVHAVSTRSAGTSKNADEAVETETGSEETALKDSESTEISEIDSKDAETGSEEVDESSLDKAEAEEKETTKSSTDSSQDAEQVSEKDDTVEEEKVSDDNESEKSNAEDSSKEDSSDDSKSEDSTDSDSASNEDSSDSSDDADSRSDDTDDTSDTDNE